MRNTSAFQPKGTTKGYWTLNGNSTDYSGSANHGTETAITYPQGKFGRGAKFDGSTSKINLPTSVVVGGGAAQTHSIWFKLGNNTQADKDLTNITDDVTDVTFDHNYNNGTYAFRRIKQGVAVDQVTKALSDTASFHNAVGVYSGTTLSLYLDGGLAGSVSASGNGSIASTKQAFLGANNTTQYFTGSIDEVIIESRAWTAAEVSTYYRKSMLNYNKGFWAKLLQSFSILEVATLTETISNLRARQTSVSETATLTESITSALGKIFTILETTTVSEALTTTRSFLANISDTIGLTEVLIEVKRKWSNVSKSVSSWTNSSKNDSNWTNNTKNSSDWTNDTKN